MIKTLTTLLLLAQVVIGANLTDEAPIIRTAAERNGIRYKSDDWYLLLAIRLSENGRQGREFGIMNPKANNLDKQAGWASATIMNHHKRFGSAKVTPEFIHSLGKRYCPVGADNDPKGLNKNWIKNVTFNYRRLKNV